jgi:uncharacterized membrane protein HdeD (DUF308 family)
VYFRLIHEKSPNWFRSIQIGLGIVILILSILVLINPIFSTILVILILAFMLLLAGIEKVTSGLILHRKARVVNIGLGIIVIAISLIALIYPIGASIVVVQVLGIALLVQGISRIIYGMKNKNISKGSRGFRVGVGVISIIFSVVKLTIPKIGLIYTGIFIGISLLVTSIQIITEGIKGFPKRMHTN